MRALHFAIATANQACQSAFLFIATHFPMFIASSSAASATLLQCGFQYCIWNSYGNCSPTGMPPVAVKMIGSRLGTKSIPSWWHRGMCLSVFGFSADLVPA